MMANPPRKTEISANSLFLALAVGTKGWTIRYPRRGGGVSDKKKIHARN